MHFALVAFLAGSLAAPLAQKEKPAPPDPKQVEAAVKELDAAFKDGKPADRVAAIRKNHAIADAKVVNTIVKGLKDADLEVQLAAVDALGRNEHPEALDDLHRFYKAEVKRLKDDTRLMPMVIQAIGRQGNEKSIEILSDDIFAQRTFPAVKARLWGLANIRSKKSVDAILEMMNKVGNQKLQDYMVPIRVALLRLTGTDNGSDPQAWMAWWRKNDKTFEIPKDAPKMPELAEKAWNDYWGAGPGEDPSKETGEAKEGEKKGG
jgi:HEAT repeat protein